MAASLGSRCVEVGGARAPVHARLSRFHNTLAHALLRPPPRPRPRLAVTVAAAMPASLPRPVPWEGGSDVPAPGGDPSGGESRSSPSSSPSSSSSSSSSSGGGRTGLKPLPRNVEGVADDVSLANPLQRMERLGTAWFGTIFELDGVCIEQECGDGGRSWQQLAAEEGKAPPPLWALKKAQGMKNEQVVSEVFCWTRNPAEARRLAARREAILAELLGGRKPLVPGGVTQLMDLLQRNQVRGPVEVQNCGRQWWWVGRLWVRRAGGWRRHGGPCGDGSDELPQQLPQRGVPDVAAWQGPLACIQPALLFRRRLNAALRRAACLLACRRRWRSCPRRPSSECCRRWRLRGCRGGLTRW